jgi:hypothetical protein
VKFQADISGFISGIRFYKSPTNTGLHVATLWNTSGQVLARANFVGESGSGWQQVNFPTPIAISANTTYIASYHTNTGHYAADVGFFTNAGVDNPPLHALRNGVSGTNGVYAYNANPVFPTNSFQSSNYWVDVVFTTSPPATPSSIWPPSATPAVLADADAVPIELGVKFRSDVAGRITGIRFYKATTNTGTHTAKLWSSTGTLLASATFSNETGSGWQQVSFPTPVSIQANTTYVASYHTNTGHYSIDDQYFATSSFDNGPLHALSNSAAGGNGVYIYGASAFPTNTFHSSNYWVDVVFTSP